MKQSDFWLKNHLNQVSMFNLEDHLSIACSVCDQAIVMIYYLTT